MLYLRINFDGTGGTKFREIRGVANSTLQVQLIAAATTAQSHFSFAEAQLLVDGWCVCKNPCREYTRKERYNEREGDRNDDLAR